MPKWKSEVACSNGYPCSKEAMHVRDNFRLLWRQHAYWTRMVIINIAYDLPNSDGTRLNNSDRKTSIP